MKTAQLPAIRVEPGFREDLESVLVEGETLSSFTEQAVRAEVNYRKIHSAFLARGRASLVKARQTGQTVSAESVIGKLDKIIEAKRAKP